ncbi:MAG TPA: hypothetical protein ENK02_10025 [Planctomycetes bacterium]|nr:hypothetical protein [Planctomycetota bacterium]
MSKKIPLLLAILLSTLHFLWLKQVSPPVFSSPDAGGYYPQAALMAETGQDWFRPETPLRYLGLHWLETPDGRFFSRYPPGVAVLLLIPYKLWGPGAALRLTLLLGSLSLLLAFLLIQKRANSWLALGLVTAIAFHPDLNEQAINWGAHTHVGFFLLLGTLCLDSWSRNPKAWKVALAGLAFGAIPSFRYAEVVAGIGVAAFLLYIILKQNKRYLDLVWGLLGAALPIGALMWRNAKAFGSPFLTGYALTGEQQFETGFRLEFLGEKWNTYFETLMGQGVGLAFGFAVFGLILMLRERKQRPMALLVAGICIPITLVYSAYYWGSGGRSLMSGLRFLLPTIPLWLIPAGYCFKQTLSSKGARLGFAAILLLQIGIWAPKTFKKMDQIHLKLQGVQTAVEYLDQHVPQGAALITDRRLDSSLQYYPKWTLLDEGLVSSISSRSSRWSRWLRRNRRGRGSQVRYPRNRTSRPLAGPADPQGSNRPNRASPMQRNKGKRLRKAYEIKDRKKRAQRIAADLVALTRERGQEVFWLARSSRTVEGVQKELPEGTEFVKIGKLKLPKPPPPPGGRPRRGRGFGALQRGVASMFAVPPGTQFTLYRLEVQE